ncbi:MAG TPA: redoxin family protein [Vicinamibacterales bacterium]|nr:redoxin family protein [Vicinamibacterales bacterium]
MSATARQNDRHRTRVGIAAAGRVAGRMAIGVALTLVTAIGAAAQGRGIRPAEHPVLPIGSDLPSFTLPGIDGRTHSSREFTRTKLLAIVFESNHCPVSQLYEGRIEQLYKDYRSKGVTLVAINPNNAKAVRLDELGYTDVTDSLPEMKIRAAFRGITWPYLYDGETQELSMKFGAVATPHIFIFDEHHKLAYQGRIDDNQREDLVKSHDARNALDALLAGRPVPVANTRAFGCTTKWLYKSQDVAQEWARIQAEPVTVEPAAADDLKTLRGNPTDKVTVVDFWSTACKACQDQLVDFETTYRMYRLRAFNLVTVSTDAPAAQDAVLAFLKQQHASSPNKQFASADRAALQAAWGATWNPTEPYVMVLAPGGQVLYQKTGKIDILSVRRVVLANMPDMRAYIGQKAYWMAAVAADRAKHR